MNFQGSVCELSSISVRVLVSLSSRVVLVSQFVLVDRQIRKDIERTFVGCETKVTSLPSPPLMTS